MASINEEDFQTWYSKHAKRLKLNPDPDAEEHYYDYRAAYKAGDEPDETGHWPSKHKKEGHPRLYIDGKDTRTGESINTIHDAVRKLYRRGK